jgi:hypothetical protein
MGSFAPLCPIDGYLPLEDYGLIGDGTTAALVGRDGAIRWLCVPRFDASPLFCGVLDAARGGAFTVAPEDLVESRQFYEPDTGVLVTEMRGRSGVLRLTDALTLRSGAKAPIVTTCFRRMTCSAPRSTLGGGGCGASTIMGRRSRLSAARRSR